MRPAAATTLLALLACAIAGAAMAAGGDIGQVDKQATNWVAIAMFSLFVLGTLWKERPALLALVRHFG